MIVPVHLKVLRVVAGANPEPIFDGTVETQSHPVHGFSEKRFHGNYRRMIAVIALEPGLYRLQVHTIKEGLEFAGTPSHVNIEWHSNTGPLGK